MAKRLYTEPALTFDDVLLVPQFNDIASRKDVDISSIDKSGKLKLKLPIMSANMDTITGHKMANFMTKVGGIGVLHRFMSIEDNVKEFKLCEGPVFVSVGCGEKELERASLLFDAGATYFCIDVAHAHSPQVRNQLHRLRKFVGDTSCIMAGNVVTEEAARYLEANGADIVKAGVGSGCFAAGTRVLMSDGYYKNIEDIRENDHVINMYGEPVRVTSHRCTGSRSVVRYRHSHSIGDTYCTGDHKHFVGDLNSISKKTLSSAGYKRSLNKQSLNGESKFKWKQISDVNQDVLLHPSRIRFDAPSSITIDLSKYGKRKQSLKRLKTLTVSSCYELGYLFGTYLGDGHARYSSDNSGCTNWYYNVTENNTIKKTIRCIESVFGMTPKVRYYKNMTIVALYSVIVAKMFEPFGKRIDKMLPKSLFALDQNYLRGISDGLIDSDGYIAEEHGKLRTSLSNTSKQIMELFNVITVLLEESHPQYIKSSVQSSKKVIGKNFSHQCRLLTRKMYRSISLNFDNILINMLISKVLDFEQVAESVLVYDIEVDCPSHSFIANGAIVHNSVCSTRIKSGHGMPQLTAISESSKCGVSIVADGNIRSPGDIVKAFAFGAYFVMIGGMLSGTSVTPGDIYCAKSGRKVSKRKTWWDNEVWSCDSFDEHMCTLVKKYRGMASKEVNDEYFGGLAEWKTAEGVSVEVPYRTDEDSIIADIIGGIRSGLTYSGSCDIKELQEKAQYVVITNSGMRESLPHKQIG